MICDFIYYQIFKYLCELRRKEGYFINKSLVDLKKSLSTFIISKFTAKTYNQSIKLPFYFAGTSSADCYDNNLSFNIFSFFNDISDGDYNYNERGIILDTIFKSTTKKRAPCFDLDPTNTKLIFFTVVNLNDLIGKSADKLPLPTPDKNIKNGTKRISNNPPLPPYINTNVLKKFINYKQYLTDIYNFLTSNKIEEDHEMYANFSQIYAKLSERYKTIKHAFINHVLDSPYYEKNKKFCENLRSPSFLNFNILNDDEDVQDDITQTVLDEIEMNNETTLIGSVDFSNFAEVRNPGNLYPICDDVMNFKDLENFHIKYEVDESVDIKHSHKAVHSFMHAQDTSQTGLEQKEKEKENEEEEGTGEAKGQEEEET